METKVMDEMGKNEIIMEQTARQWDHVVTLQRQFFGSLKSNVESYQTSVQQALEIRGGLITQGFMWKFNGHISSFRGINR